MQNSKFKIQSLAIIFCIFNFALLIASCGSVPNLEPPKCTESRLVVKEFYSYHFANEMKFSPENLQKRAKFLTPEYFKLLQTVRTENDVFTTNTDDFAKSFRVGKCIAVEESKTVIEIVLFWKDDSRTEQKAVNVEVVEQNEKWLINKISN